MKSLVNTFMYIFLIQLSWITLAQPRSDREKDQLLKDLESNIDDTTRVLKLQDLSRYYILKVGENKVDMDKSYYYARQSETESNKIDYDKGKWTSLILYSQILRESGKRELGRVQLDKAFNIAIKQQILWLEAECYRELSEYYGFKKINFLKRIFFVTKAVELAKKGGTIKQQADLLVFLGWHYNYVGKNKEALNCYDKASILYKKIDFKNTQSLHSEIAKASLKVGLYNEAVYYGLLAIKQAEKDDFDFYLSVDYNTVGLAYYNMYNYEMALQFHEKALNYSYRIIDKRWYSIEILYNLINDCLALGMVDEAKKHYDNYEANYFIKKDINDELLLMCQMNIYDHLNKFEIADHYVKRLVDKRNKFKNNFSDMTELEVNYNLINHYFKVKKYELVSKYLNQNKLIFKQSLDVNLLNKNQLLEFKLDSVRGNYLKAIGSFNKYQKTKDSLFNSNKAYQIASLQIKYETDKKDNNIHLLTNESLIQKVIIEKDRVTKLVISVVLILFLIIICLLFRRYRSKIKSNKVLLIKQNEIEKMNDSLKLYVEEKELLLKEIHHRVKNNLQIVMSLLSSQSSYLTDKASIVAIKDSQHRIYSMSLIHQKLYQSEGICIIKMPEYIRELIGYLRDSYQNNIQFEINVDEIALDTTIAIPIGLIINEAITNTFKHAFPNNRKGIVKIQLRKSTDSTVVLKISDDGIGIPESIDTSQLNSLGMSLMEGLSREMNGNLKVTRLNGTTVSVEFPI